MKYKHIIQEMKESGDPSMMAFVKDVEKMKRLSNKEKVYCLRTRFLPESVQKLVEDFIPYIIFVAYCNKDKAKNLRMLDLINEGILGAYAGFERSTKDGMLTKYRVQHYIRNRIRKAINIDYCQSIAEYSFEICVPEGQMNNADDVISICSEIQNIKEYLQ